MFTNWANAAMALHKLETIETVLQDVIKRTTPLFAALNKINGINIRALEGAQIFTNSILTRLLMAKSSRQA